MPFVCTPNVSIALRHVPYHASAVKWSRRPVALSSFLPCCCSPEVSRVQPRGADPSSVVAARILLLVLVAGHWTKWQVSHCPPLWQTRPPGRGPVAPAATTCRGGLSSGLTQQTTFSASPRLARIWLASWRDHITIMTVSVHRLDACSLAAQSSRMMRTVCWTPLSTYNAPASPLAELQADRHVDLVRLTSIERHMTPQGTSLVSYGT